MGVSDVFHHSPTFKAKPNPGSFSLSPLHTFLVHSVCCTSRRAYKHIQCVEHILLFSPPFLSYSSFFLSYSSLLFTHQPFLETSSPTETEDQQFGKTAGLQVPGILLPLPSHSWVTVNAVLKIWNLVLRLAYIAPTGLSPCSS